MATLTKADYRAVQVSGSPFPNPKVAQEFLNELDLEDAKKFVYDVRYVVPDCKSSEEEINGNIYMICGKDYFDFPERFGIGIPKSIRSRIEVYPASFYLPFPLFLSALIDHEGQHARQNYLKPILNASIYAKMLTIKNPKKLLYYELLDEIPAYANEVALSECRQINSHWSTDAVVHSIEMVGRLRKRFHPIRDAEEDLRARLCNSQGDNLVRELLETDRIQRAIRGEGI